ncbi:hypothetical protein HZC08_00810 [Candidatus Micrarchaeota archaeon]|nr:hypothetical protein [Candidatus Micrarchaeota archaeon]
MAPQAFKEREQEDQLKTAQLRPELNKVAIQATKVAAMAEKMIKPYLPKDSEILAALQDAQKLRNIQDVKLGMA